jgi:cytochrome c oxidase subunit 3
MFFSSNPNSHFFYLVTGTHAVHLFLGIGALLFAFVAMFRLKKVELRQIAVDCTAWYWHAMSVFWAFLFVLLVFFQ